MESNHATEPAETSLSGKSVNSLGTLATKLKTKRTVAATAKSEAKVRARTPRLSRAKSAGGNLVCRYCGSDDLAPSFKKRRDALPRLLQETLWIQKNRPANCRNQPKGKGRKVVGVGSGKTQCGKPKQEIFRCRWRFGKSGTGSLGP